MVRMVGMWAAAVFAESYVPTFPNHLSVCVLIATCAEMLQ